MAARLKVFITSDGFTDFVVATSSRPKALSAWGVRQDLFKEGRASETDDPALVLLALEQPGKVLRRPAGSREALSRFDARRAKRKPAVSAARIRAMEARIAALVVRHKSALAALEQRRAALDQDIEALKQKQADEQAAIDAELRALRAKA